MNSTAQWSILWNTALFPPQEMLPPDSLFCTLPCGTTPATNSEHLFGFAPCVPLVTREDSSPHERDMTEIQRTDNFYDTCEDFSAQFAVEEFTSFI